jgi:cytochrome aa3-600 menaquinol oxidase subunit 1
MGSGADVNAFFALTTMLISIPTGVKVFNWLFTMFRGKITFETPMLWTIGIIPNFVIGGMTGVLLSVAPADFQYHNSYFLIAHFHQVIIAGVVFGYFAGLYYWWPKVFGFKLNERIGKLAFWLWNIGFYLTFMPQYALGFMGMTRRVYTYGWDKGWFEMNLVSTIGAVIMGIAFIVQIWDITHSIKHMRRDTTGDPWDARTLEWSIPSPAPLYNFATLPQVTAQDDWWERKLRMEKGEKATTDAILEPIHMPKNSGIPFIMSMCWFFAGFGLVFDWLWLTIPGLIGVAACMIAHSFNYDTDYYIPVEDVERIEAAIRKVNN